MEFLFKSLLALSLLTFATVSAEERADVIVYGSAPGGFCAAIAASREGASVILLEPTDHVGGVNTGGLSFSDSNQTVRSTVMGLFDEWHNRIAADYESRGVKLNYDPEVKDSAKWTYEPSVAARVTNEMLEEANVRVETGQWLTEVIKAGARIESIRCGEREFAATTYVDATYEGDLMAAAGVDWTIGRESRNAFGESLAGRQYPKSPMPISGLDQDGNLLPLLTASGKGSDTEGDGNVMVYSFRLCLTKDPENRVDFPEPDAYDPARFEAIRRYYSVEKRPHLLWDIYPLPNGKFDANNGIGKQFSMGLVGGCNGWSEAGEEGREDIWEEHRQYTLELYHFLTTDPAVPENLRQELSAYGLCRDEFPATDHWSPQLYVREGRRMQGRFVITQADIMENPKKEDPIAVSSFPIDSHDCRRIGLADSIINEGTIFPVRMEGRPCGYPYHIPYRSITPRVEQCENLLVPVALSCTHVGISSIRVEPTWMIIGQSAGIAAALASSGGTRVQSVPYEDLKTRLIAQGQVLELPTEEALPGKRTKRAGSVDPKSIEGIVLDDTQFELEGTWKQSANFQPFIGGGYLHDDGVGMGQSRATVRFEIPEAGLFEILVAYSPHETRAASVPVEIEAGGEKVRIKIDQKMPLPSGRALRSVGKVQLPAAAEATLTITNEGTTGFVILDAFVLRKVDE